MNISRRSFIKRTLAAGVSSGLILSGANKIALAGEKNASKVGTFIDLTKCDGCKGQNIPACVQACRTQNESKFPNPVENIQNYWPQKKNMKTGRIKETLPTGSPLITGVLSKQ